MIRFGRNIKEETNDFVIKYMEGSDDSRPIDFTHTNVGVMQGTDTTQLFLQKQMGGTL